MYKAKILVHYVHVIMHIKLCTSYMLIPTEFCTTNGNWRGYNVPVHPGLSLHKSQDNNYHVNVCDLHTTSKLYDALCTPF